MRKLTITCLGIFVSLVGLTGYGMVFPQSLIGASFLTITDGTNTVLGVQKLIVTGGIVGGGNNAATLAISGGGLSVPNSTLIGGDGHILTTPSASAATGFLNTFTGDSGSGGVKGLVPAPAAGDAAVSKVLGAGGGWVNRSGGVRSQAGGSLLSTDASKLVYNTGGTGPTLPAHTTTGFGSGFATTLLTDSTAAPLTVTTDTCNGNSTESLGIKQGIEIFGDGTTTYKCLLGMPEPVASSVLTATSGRVPQWSTTLPAGLLPQTIHYGATSQTITPTQWLNGDVFVIATAGQTLTLPAVTTLAPSGRITIITIGSIVTLTPDPADGINALSTGSPALIPANLETTVTTSGSSGASALRVPLGRGGHFTFSWGASQNLSTPGNAGIPIGRVASTSTIYSLNCNPSVVVGGAATFDVYTAPSATALGSGTKLNTTSCNANTGAGTTQNLGIASASVATGSWIGIVASGAGWASSAGWGGLDVEFR